MEKHSIVCLKRQSCYNLMACNFKCWPGINDKLVTNCRAPCTGKVLILTYELSAVKLKFHLARLDSTRHIQRVEPMHFGCVELVEQHSSTRSTRRARLARHVELDRRYLQLVMITVIHLLFNKLFTD